jgi:hypothetical protein
VLRDTLKLGDILASASEGPKQQLMWGCKARRLATEGKHARDVGACKSDSGLRPTRGNAWKSSMEARDTQSWSWG